MPCRVRGNKDTKRDKMTENAQPADLGQEEQEYLFLQIVLSSFSQFFESFSTSNLVQPQDLLHSLPVFGCWLIWGFRCRAFHDGFNSAGQELIHQFRELLSLCSLRKPFHVPRHLPNHLTFSPSRRFSHSFLRLQCSPTHCTICLYHATMRGICIT